MGIVLFSQRGEIKTRTKDWNRRRQVCPEHSLRRPESRAVKNPATMESALSCCLLRDKISIPPWKIPNRICQHPQNLENTKMELASTKSELESTKTQIVELTDRIAQKEADLAQANSRARNWSRIKPAAVQIDDLNNQMVRARKKPRDLQDQVATRKRSSAISTGRRAPRPAGLRRHHRSHSGRQSRLEFRHSGHRSEVGLAPTTEMLVHRSDSLVGKVRISNVKDHMSIAEIVTDWEQAPSRRATVFSSKIMGIPRSSRRFAS
jgi:hypothetical protein